MRILLDSCLSGGVAEALCSDGNDVEYTGDWPGDPGDEEILAFACREQRVVITMDKDFGELTVCHGMPHCGIVRLVGFRSGQQELVCRRIVSDYTSDLQTGALITAEPGRIRVRRPHS